MPLKAGRPGPALSNAAAPAGVASDGAGVLPPPLGHGYDGIYCEGAQCATHWVVQSRCHTEEIEPGRFVRRFKNTEQFLRDCVGRENSTLLRRFTETIDGKKRGWR